MKKIIFTTAILFLFVSCTVTKQEKAYNTSYQHTIDNSMQTVSVGTAQVEKHKENKSETSNNTNASSALTQKKTDNDYNPYQHQREEYIKTGEEFFEEFKKVDCENEETRKYIENAINGYNNGKYIGTEFGIISQFLGKMYCPEIIAFFEEVVKKDSSETVRCDAIQKLGWLRAINSVPTLMEQLNKDISDYEKACIGSCLTIIGEWKLAETALNSVCFCKDDDIQNKCLWSYYTIGNESAIRYFNYFFDFPESKLWAALFLARLGEYEKTFPVFVEAIHNKTGINAALYGLAAIGTEESFLLIKEQIQNENEMIAKTAKWIFQYIDIKRREK